MCDQEFFNLKSVYEHFQGSLHEDDDVIIKNYLDSYGELNKFFNLMGTVFGFVSSDLKSKMDILSGLLNENPENFESAKKMITYEKENNLLNKEGYTSGSRTLLRLHRGLDFIRLFLKNIGELQPNENTSHVCRAAYNETLAKYHSFLIATGARLAMYTMPIKSEMLKKIYGEDEEVLNSTMAILPKTLEVTALVYKRVEDLYTFHDLHKLP